MKRDSEEIDEKYGEAIENAKEWSKLLKALYEIMEKSKTVYVIKTEETSISANGERNPGEFNSETNTITLDKNRQFSLPTILEEMYHAYQKESGSLSDFNNQEFEAKVVVLSMLTEMQTVVPNILGNDFWSKITLGIYGNNENSIIPSSINSTISADYMYYGTQYSRNNLINFRGNINYSTPVTKVLNSLITLSKSFGINETDIMYCQKRLIALSF